MNSKSATITTLYKARTLDGLQVTFSNSESCIERPFRVGAFLGSATNFPSISLHKHVAASRGPPSDRPLHHRGSSRHTASKIMNEVGTELRTVVNDVLVKYACMYCCNIKPRLHILVVYAAVA